MLDKKYLHHLWVKTRNLNAFYFLVVSLVFGVISILAMRQNNLKMIDLRQKVAVVDQQNGDVETALRNLREFVYGHMNTNLNSGGNSIKPPIQLKYRYERLVQAEKDRVGAETTKVYTEAQKSCEAQFPQSFSGGPRVPCIQDYVTSHTVAERTIDSSLYKFDFVSPAWSPDIAGWCLVLSGIFLFLFVFKYVLDRWLKSELNT